MPAAAAVETHFLADLVVEDRDITFDPPNPSVGDTVTFTVSVLNQGEGDAGPSKLSYTVARDAETILVGEVDVPSIPKGGSESVFFDWTADAGVHSFTIKADATDQVHETANIDNNKAHLHYSGTLLADLIVESIDWTPDSPVMGEAVTLSATIRNKGEGRAGASRVELYVDDGLLGEAELPSILPGESETVSFTWDAKVGPLSLRALADSGQAIIETDDGNNELTKAYESTIFADLIVEDITWKPESPSVGNEVTFAVTVKNQGTLDVPESIVELSRIWQDDADSSSKGQIDGIQAGGSATATFRWQAEPGAFTLRARADVDRTIGESDEDNNDADEQYDATVLADLIVETIGWEPEKPSVGDTVTFRVVIENVGEASAADFHVSFRDKSGVWPPMEKTVSDELAAGQTIIAYFEWLADADSHQLVVAADSMEEVIESNEDNNEHTVEYNATALADLIVTGIAWEPDRPVIGQGATLTVTLHNGGGGAAPDAGVRLFVDDVEHGEPATLTKLYPQESGTVSFSWTAEIGMHTFRADVDYDNQVVETDETNNTSETFEYDHTRLADLTVREVGWEPTMPSVGDTVTFGVVVENLGEAPAQDFHVSFGGKSSVWPPMEKMVSGALAAGQTLKVYFEWPADADRHQFTVGVDSQDDVIESDEGNNEHTFEYGATALADLVVSSITWIPARPSVGESTTVEVTIKNTGQGGSERFTVSLAIDGIHYEEKHVNGVDAGKSVDLGFEWDAQDGGHMFTATADSEGVIAETEEGNNGHTVEYGATALADLIVKDIVWEPERPVIGKEVTVAVTLKNAGEGDALDSEVRLFIDDIEHGEAASLPRLSTQGSGTVGFNWIAEIGTHTFSADVDHDDRVVESDETNNASGTFQYDHTRVADLIVRGINWEPENTSVGETVTFGVEIENVGEATAEDFHVSFGDESSVWQPIEKVVSDDLAPGQIVRVYFEWPADAAQHLFVAAADSQGEVIESNEDNNEHSVEYDATVVADIVIRHITWNPASPLLDERVTIEVTLENVGQGSSGQFSVSLAIDGIHYRKRPVDNVDAGQSVVLRFGWDAQAGPHTFTATADPEDAVSETQEDNNTRSVEYDDTELADLAVEGKVVSVSPDSPVAGDEVTIGLRVLNRSRASSDRFTVSLYVGGSNQPHGSERIGSIDGRDESAYVRFTWQAKQGCHNFRVVVDSGDDVVESDEHNNQVEFSICVSANSGS